MTGLEARRQALTIGAGLAFFVLAAAGMAITVNNGLAQIPYIMSLPSLGIVAVVAYEMARALGSVRRISGELHESQQRIRTMALIHERLYKSGNLARIGFKEYLDSLVGQLVRSMGTETIGWTVEGDDVLLSIGQAIPAALIVNELVTNALKHAFPGGGRGRIVVGIFDRGDSLTEFSVRDDGRGLPVGFNIHQVETLGMQLVATLSNQLDGDLAVEQGPGAAFVVRFRRD